jgi:hypothetical protein
MKTCPSLYKLTLALITAFLLAYMVKPNSLALKPSTSQQNADPIRYRLISHG